MEKPIIFSRPQTARMRETLTKTMENIELKKSKNKKKKDYVYIIKKEH